MPDTALSALPVASSAALADQIELLQAAANKRLTLTLLKALMNTAPLFAAGSAIANSWPEWTPGALLTTPEVGAIELDTTNFYGTTDAGNRGYIPVRHYIRADSARTLTSQTAAQPIFNSPANGRITLETGTYFFEGLLSVNTMSATSGNAQITFGGTGTFGSWLWYATGVDGATGTAAAQSGSTSVSNASAASIVTGATGTVMNVLIKGSFECTVAGTWIPQIALVTANAAVVAVGSFISLERIGSTTAASVGQWD